MKLRTYVAIGLFGALVIPPLVDRFGVWLAMPILAVLYGPLISLMEKES